MGYQVETRNLAAGTTEPAPVLQRVAVHAGPVASVRKVLLEPGQPLDANVRALLELRFGHGFSGVRVHAHRQATESTRALHARAYTVGRDVVFGPGQYAHATSAGRRLLSHELAHVAQRPADDARSSTDLSEIGTQDVPAEREAAQAGQQLGRTPTPLSSQREPRLRRQPEGNDDEQKKVRQPIIPGPIGAPSLEDINKGLGVLRGLGQDHRGNTGCMPGQEARTSGPTQGLCCLMYVTAPDRCCPPYRQTVAGRCCPTHQYAEGAECKKYPDFQPTSPIVPGGGKDAPPPRRFVPSPRQDALQLAPLTVNLDIYFQHSRPGGTVQDAAELRESMTTSGAATFDTLVNWLKTGPQFLVQLTGKASVEGLAAHNRDLGEWRAHSVAQVLTQQGISASRITDPPGMAACAKLEEGIHNCGAASGSKTVDEHDRQVQATLFTAPRNP
jgi:hypothetical protein